MSGMLDADGIIVGLRMLLAQYEEQGQADGWIVLIRATFSADGGRRGCITFTVSTDKASEDAP
jgi:hypothetical protein